MNVSICPSDGEEIGAMYRDRAREATNPRAAISLYQSAARWFRAGAAASIGHNRSARYEAAASKCEAEAQKLIDAASL